MPRVDLNTVFTSAHLILMKASGGVNYHYSHFRDKAMAA